MVVVVSVVAFAIVSILLWRSGGRIEGLGGGRKCNDPRFMHTSALALGATQTCMYLGKLGEVGLYWVVEDA